MYLWKRKKSKMKPIYSFWSLPKPTKAMLTLIVPSASPWKSHSHPALLPSPMPGTHTGHRRDPPSSWHVISTPTITSIVSTPPHLAPGLSPTKLTSWQSHPLPSEGQHALASIRTGVSDHPACHWIAPLATISIVTSGRDRRRWCGAGSGRDGKRGGGAGRAPWTVYEPTLAAATVDCPRICQTRRRGWPLPVADVAIRR